MYGMRVQRMLSRRARANSNPVCMATVPILTRPAGGNKKEARFRGEPGVDRESSGSAPGQAFYTFQSGSLYFLLFKGQFGDCCHSHHPLHIATALLPLLFRATDYQKLLPRRAFAIGGYFAVANPPFDRFVFIPVGASFAGHRVHLLRFLVGAPGILERSRAVFPGTPSSYWSRRPLRTASLVPQRELPRSETVGGSGNAGNAAGRRGGDDSCPPALECEGESVTRLV